MALIGILAGGFIGLFSETALNIALPTLMQELKVDEGTVQLLITGYMLVIGIVLPLSGLISHWFPTKQLMLFAVTIFATGSVMAACAPNFGWLLFGRMIQGIGTGLLLPLMFTIAALLFPPQKLGTVLGIIGLVIMFAPALGPTISGVILQNLSWRWIFWLFLPILVVAWILIRLTVPNLISQTKPKFSWSAVIASAAGFGMLVTAASLVSNLGITSPLVLGLLAVAVVILFGYIHQQLNSSQPILNFKIFKNREFNLSTWVIALNFGIIISSMYLLPLLFQRGLGISAIKTGLWMLPGGLVNAFVSAASGRLYDRFGARKLASGGVIFALLGLTLLIVLTSRATIAHLVTVHILLMIGVALIMSPVQTFGLSHLKRQQSGDGSTIMNTLQQISGALATAVTTTLMAWGSSLAETDSQRAAFIFSSHFGFGFILLLAMIVGGLIFGIKAKFPSHEEIE